MALEVLHDINPSRRPPPSLSSADLVDTIEDAITWLAEPQDHDAIGSRHGIRTYLTFHVAGGEYDARLIPWTENGRPQIVFSTSNAERLCVVPSGDAIEAFTTVVDLATKRLESEPLVDACSIRFAIDCKVNPSLIRAVTTNYQSQICSGIITKKRMMECPATCGPCPMRLDAMNRFRIPNGWRYA